MVPALIIAIEICSCKKSWAKSKSQPKGLQADEFQTADQQPENRASY